MKANNSIFVIDDFGRQHISPRELLNRWIVPLDRREDYLSLQYGLKFEIPFQVLVVFATNLKPSELADEAFLRPGSGKTTHAKLLEARLGAIRFSPDEWMDALS